MKNRFVILACLMPLLALGQSQSLFNFGPLNFGNPVSGDGSQMVIGQYDPFGNFQAVPLDGRAYFGNYFLTPTMPEISGFVVTTNAIPDNTNSVVTAYDSTGATLYIGANVTGGIHDAGGGFISGENVTWTNYPGRSTWFNLFSNGVAYSTTIFEQPLNDGSGKSYYAANFTATATTLFYIQQPLAGYTTNTWALGFDSNGSFGDMNLNFNGVPIVKVSSGTIYLNGTNGENFCSSDGSGFYFGDGSGGSSANVNHAGYFSGHTYASNLVGNVVHAISADYANYVLFITNAINVTFATNAQSATVATTASNFTGNVTLAQLPAAVLTNASAFDTNGAWKVPTNGYPWGNLYAPFGVTNLTPLQLAILGMALTNASAFDTNGAWKVPTNGYPWGSLYASANVTNLTPAQLAIIAAAQTNVVKVPTNALGQGLTLSGTNLIVDLSSFTNQIRVGFGVTLTTNALVLITNAPAYFTFSIDFYEPTNAVFDRFYTTNAQVNGSLKSFSTVGSNTWQTDVIHIGRSSNFWVQTLTNMIP